MKRPLVYRPLPYGRLALGGLCLALSGTASAGGIILYEVGTADVGLASAGYSTRAQDAGTILSNPADMTRLPGRQLLLGAQALYGDVAAGAAIWWAATTPR